MITLTFLAASMIFAVRDVPTWTTRAGANRAAGKATAVVPTASAQGVRGIAVPARWVSLGLIWRSDAP